MKDEKPDQETINAIIKSQRVVSSRQRLQGLELEPYVPSGRGGSHLLLGQRALALFEAITGRKILFVGAKDGSKITAFAGFRPSGTKILVVNKDARFGLMATLGHEWFHSLPRAERDAYIAEVKRQRRPSGNDERSEE